MISAWGCYIVGWKSVQMRSVWGCHILGCKCVRMKSVWGLLHCRVQVCSDEKRLGVVTKWRESVFR